MDDRLGHFDHWLGPRGSGPGSYGPVAEFTKTLGSTTVALKAARCDPFRHARRDNVRSTRRLPNCRTRMFRFGRAVAMSRLVVATRSVSGPLSGDYTRQETRVPIPNTTVKLPGPMIVPTSAKVGYRRDFSTRLESPHGGSGRFFCALFQVLVLVAVGLLAHPHRVSAARFAQTSPQSANASVRRLLDAVPQQRRHRTLLDRARARLQANDSNLSLIHI